MKTYKSFWKTESEKQKRYRCSLCAIYTKTLGKKLSDSGKILTSGNAWRFFRTELHWIHRDVSHCATDKSMTVEPVWASLIPWNQPPQNMYNKLSACLSELFKHLHKGRENFTFLELTQGFFKNVNVRLIISSALQMSETAGGQYMN